MQNSENTGTVRDLTGHLVQPATETWILSQWGRCSLCLNTSANRELVSLGGSICHLWMVLLERLYLQWAEIYLFAYSTCRALISPFATGRTHQLSLPWDRSFFVWWLDSWSPWAFSSACQTPQVPPPLLTWPGFKSLQQLDLSSLDRIPLLFTAPEAKDGSHWWVQTSPEQGNPPPSQQQHFYPHRKKLEQHFLPDIRLRLDIHSAN